jgi:hypothetical protein
MDWRLIAGVAAAALIAAVMILRQFFQKPPDPEEEERRRRFQLNQVGRIVEGLVVEVVEAPAGENAAGGISKAKAFNSTAIANGARRLVRYSYSISGVTYETAQDVTGLESRVNLQSIAAGQPASVKYDPANPTNSILVADDWSGVH